MNLIALLFTDRFVEFLKTASSHRIEFVESCLKRHYAGDVTGYEDLKLYCVMFGAVIAAAEEM